MDKWTIFKRVVAVCALILSSVVVIGVFVILGITFSDSSSNIASWVQAVGAIAAIVAGALGLGWQARAQSRQATEMRLDQIKLIANALFRCRASTSFCLRYGQESDSLDAIHQHGEDACWWVSSLTSIPMQDYPNYSAHSIVAGVIFEGRRFRDALSEFQRTGSRRPLMLSARALINSLKSAEINMETHLRRFGTYSPTGMFEINGEKFYPAGRDYPGPVQKDETFATHQI